MKQRLLLIPLTLFSLLACQNLNDLPAGLAYAGNPQPAQNVEFLADLTWVDTAGQRHVQQEIFDEIFRVIGNARQFILLDMFLYNDFQGPVKETTRPLSQQLTDALTTQKRRFPNMEIIVITDPINNVYGGLPSEQLQQVREAGIELVITNLEALRDSNPVYSFFWRLFIKPFGTSSGNTLPSPFGEGRVSIRSNLRLLNFKANHRKTLLADSPQGYVGLVTSANPHDGSSAHRNVAVKFSGAALQDLYHSEIAVLALSNAAVPATRLPRLTEKSTLSVQLLTEKKIETAVLEIVSNAAKNDHVDLMMFYLSDRDIIEALKEAQQRGVNLRVLLDPNKDAFGREKNGIPNRPVAHELQELGVPVRWCDTHGEQCHAKMLIRSAQTESSALILGSANYTRRNLENFNLETDVLIQGPEEAAVFADARSHFDLMWNNTKNKIMSTDYETYADASVLKRWLYRVMEATGISTF